MTTINIHGETFREFISEDAIALRVVEMAEELDLRYRDKNPVFLGVLKGVFVFLADLIRACPFESQTTFTKVSSYDGLESTGEIHLSLAPDIDLRGRHVILVEDIVDSGNTLSKLIPMLHEQQPASLSVVTFLFKPDALKHPLQLDYVGFEIPNQFIVGYGLDYDQCGRELGGLYRKIDEVGS
jgi:hypoxanthine phosphoribosyltransferase